MTLTIKTTPTSEQHKQKAEEIAHSLLNEIELYLGLHDDFANADPDDQPVAIAASAADLLVFALAQRFGYVNSLAQVLDMIADMHAMQIVSTAQNAGLSPTALRRRLDEMRNKTLTQLEKGKSK